MNSITDKEKTYIYNINQRAQRMGATGVITVGEWEDLKRQYNFTCLRCGIKEPGIKLSCDHVIPFRKGGTNTIDNIQPLCKPCNSRKWIRVLDYRPAAARQVYGEHVYTLADGYRF